MNDELKTRATEALLKLLSGAENGSDFIAGEMPSILEQLLLWKLVESAIPSAFLIASMIGLLILTSSTNEWIDDVSECLTRKGVLCVLGTSISTITGIISLTCINLDWLQILLAPTVYLLEYAAEVAR